MKKLQILSLSLLLSLFSVSTLKAQEAAKKAGFDAITMEAVQGQLEFLASDWTEGRETGEKGAYMAADYIASMFKVYGLEPGGDTPPQPRFRRGDPPPPPPKRTFYQNFNLIESWDGDEQSLGVVTKSGNSETAVNFNYKTDFSISSGQYGIEGEVPIVFVGYGLQDNENGYDDLKGLDLKGKVVVKLSGFPGHKNPGSKTYEKFKPADRNDGEGSQISWYRRGPRYPWAAEMGVLAVIEYNPDRNVEAQWAENDNFFMVERAGPPRGGVYKNMRRPDIESRFGGGVSFTVSNNVIKEMVKGLDFNFDDLEKKIEETGKPASMDLPGKFLSFKTSFNSRVVKARNVVGVLKGKDTSNIIVVGGHYDHTGIKDGWIFNGADDNASGTVGVMTIAKAMAATGIKPEKTIVFCAWTAEEKGLIGSGYFADNPWEGANILCNLNYDMISRDGWRDNKDDKRPRMTFTSSFPLFQELTEKHNKDYNIGMEINYNGSEQPGGGSDHAPFARKGIPIFYFMAGMPDEYHNFNDHVELVNWEKMQKIIQLGYLNIFELSNMDWK